jgi:hypothetical protein
VSTLLFRPPFGVDEEAVSPTGFERLRAVQQLGYRIVGSQIDANDWGYERTRYRPPGRDRGDGSRASAERRWSRGADARWRWRPAKHRDRPATITTLRARVLSWCPFRRCSP